MDHYASTDTQKGIYYFTFLFSTMTKSYTYTDLVYSGMWEHPPLSCALNKGLTKWIYMIYNFASLA